MKKIICDEKEDWAFDIYSAICGAKTRSMDGVLTFNLMMAISRWRIRVLLFIFDFVNRTSTGHCSVLE